MTGKIIMSINPSNSDDFEKKYSVIIVKDVSAKDGYDFFPVYDDIDVDCKKFKMIYHYKKISGKRNPIMVIDSLEGDDFRGRSKVISHFELNYAIRYSVEMDGLYDLPIKEEKDV